MLRKTLCGLAASTSSLLFTHAAQAQEFYLGQTLLFGTNFCPVGTMEANGALVSIANETALYSVMGTTYGGDGVTTFQLPDLRGRLPISWGNGPGLSPYTPGQPGGVASTTITIAQMAAHNHQGYAVGTSAAPNSDDPTNALSAQFQANQPRYTNQAPPNVAMAAGTAVLTPAGGSQPFSNWTPYLTLRFCIVSEGLYPPRN